MPRGPAVRESVGFMDATTLGKIEIRGKDAGEFLNRIYTNAFKKLAPGSARYGVMWPIVGVVTVSTELVVDGWAVVGTAPGTRRADGHGRARQGHRAGAARARTGRAG